MRRYTGTSEAQLGQSALVSLSEKVWVKWDTSGPPAAHSDVPVAGFKVHRKPLEVSVGIDLSLQCLQKLGFLPDDVCMVALGLIASPVMTHISQESLRTVIGTTVKDSVGLSANTSCQRRNACSTVVLWPMSKMKA